MTGYVNIPVEPREAMTPIPPNRPQVLDLTYQSHLSRGIVFERRLFQIMRANEDKREG